jgi:hypothetical protein
MRSEKELPAEGRSRKWMFTAGGRSNWCDVPVHDFPATKMGHNQLFQSLVDRFYLNVFAFVLFSLANRFLTDIGKPWKSVLKKPFELQ